MRTTLAQQDVINKYARATVAATAKEGKTTWLISSLLGALPEQEGSVVTSPAHLHVISVDSAAVEGIGHFLTNLCKADPACLGVDIWDLSGDVSAALNEQTPKSYKFFNRMKEVIDTIQREVQQKPGVHATVVSSLTGVAEAILRSISGPVKENSSGSAMDPDKWQLFANMLIELRVKLQVDIQHVFWETHVYKKPPGLNMRNESAKEAQPEKETLMIPGKSGVNWGFNVDQVWRMRREVARWPGTPIEKVFIDTQPKMDFLSSSRGASKLKPIEYDLYAVLKKLGKIVD